MEEQNIVPKLSLLGRYAFFPTEQSNRGQEEDCSVVYIVFRRYTETEIWTYRRCIVYVHTISVFPLLLLYSSFFFFFTKKGPIRNLVEKRFPFGKV